MSLRCNPSTSPSPGLKCPPGLHRAAVRKGTSNQWRTSEIRCHLAAVARREHDGPVPEEVPANKIFLASGDKPITPPPSDAFPQCHISFDDARFAPLVLYPVRMMRPSSRKCSSTSSPNITCKEDAGHGTPRGGTGAVWRIALSLRWGPGQIEALFKMMVAR